MYQLRLNCKKYFFLCVLLLGALSFKSFAQSTTITTPLPTAATSLSGANATITFAIENTNAYAMTLTDVEFYRDGATSGWTYTLWYSTTNLSGPPGNVNTPNWTSIASTTASVVSTLAIHPLFTGLSFNIPANTTYRFAMQASGASMNYGGATNVPNINAGAGVNLLTGNALIGGQNVGYSGSQTGPTFNPRFFIGSITVKRACNAITPVVPIQHFTFCQGDTTSAKITATGTNLIWRDNSGNIIAAPPAISTASPVKDTFYVSSTGTNPAGCESDRVPVTVTVNAKPTQPIITGPENYCLDDLFIPLTVTGSNIKWYSVPNGGTFTTVTPTVNTNIPGTYTWYVSQEENGCISDRLPFTITVATPPPPPLVESPVVYCRGDEAEPLLAGGQNLKWYKSSTGGLGSTIPPVPQTGAQGFTSWYVSQTVNGCEGARARIDVKIVEKPNVLIQSSAEGLCQGEELTLNYYGSGLPEYAYNWGLPTGATLTDGDGMGPIKVRFDSAGVQKVTLQVGNEGCYSGIGIKNINVKPLPEGYIDAAYNVCQDAVGLVVLDSYSPSIDTFRWDFDGGVMIHEHQDVGPYGIRWSQPGQHIIKLTVKNEECTAILYDTVMVRPLPDASFSGVPSKPVCAGDSLKLTANTIDPASSYQWKPAGFFDNYDQQSSTYARIDFMGPVSLTVTDEFGCVKTDSVTIKTQNCCIVSFPSAFTPNGDGRNDYFHPITTAHLNIKSFKVVNRWGQAVFETAEQSMGWDGTMSGEKMDMGTYFYFISYMCNGIATEQRGEVTLIR